MASSTIIEQPAPSGDLAVLFRSHRWRILATYLLFNLENLGRLAQLWFLGWAVNDLLAGRSTGLLLFAAQHLVNLALGTVRRLYDTRTFTRIYADLAARLVIEQRGRGVDISRLAARSTLSREIVDFFERDVPFLFFTLYSVAGSLVMIALFDSMLVLPCLLFLAAAGLLSRSLASRTLQLNRGLNDQIEREVGILQNEPPDQIEDHYHLLRGWRIGLSNAQAVNFGVVELLALLLLALVLVRSCAGAAANPGSLLSLLGYVVMLTNSLANMPMWIQQFSRLRDIRRRLHQDGPDA
jgi:ABC transporter transmembrane region